MRKILLTVISLSSIIWNVSAQEHINNLGQIVGEYHIPEPTQSIPVHDLKPGIYHVHLTNEKSGTAHYSSFIKQ